MHNIAILCNTCAGKGRGKQIARHISGNLTQRAVSHQVFADHWPLEYTVFSAVWIIGGDGTMNYFLNHSTHPLPPLAFIKGGTGNDFATLLYGDGPLEQTVDRILNSVPRPVDVGICNGHYFINMAGIGFDGQALKSMQTIRWLGGFIGYYYAIIKTILTFKEPRYTVRVEDHPAVIKKLLLVQVANASTTGGGFKVSPEALFDDGKLDLLLCEPLNWFRRFQKLQLIRKGLHMNEAEVSHQVIEHVEILAETPVPAQLDGELIFSDRFNISLLPGYLKFLY